MVLKLKKTVPVTVDKLDQLAEDLTKTEKAIRALMEEHERVFDKYKALQDEKEGLLDKIKQEARKRAVVGDTKVLVERPDLFISVVGRRPSTSYDYTAASTQWPDDVWKRVVVRTIDPKLVQKEVDAGNLSPVEAAKAAVVGEASTPAVTVRLP